MWLERVPWCGRLSTLLHATNRPLLCWHEPSYNGRMFEADAILPPDPVIEAYKKDVDRTLIRENLKLTVEERLQNLERLQEFANEIRRSEEHTSELQSRL